MEDPNRTAELNGRNDKPDVTAPDVTSASLCNGRVTSDTEMFRTKDDIINSNEASKPSSVTADVVILDNQPADVNADVDVEHTKDEEANLILQTDVSEDQLVDTTSVGDVADVVSQPATSQEAGAISQTLADDGGPEQMANGTSATADADVGETKPADGDCRTSPSDDDDDGGSHISSSSRDRGDGVNKDPPLDEDVLGGDVGGAVPYSEDAGGRGEAEDYEDEELSVLSSRIAKKSDLSSSEVYMLCSVLDDDYDDLDEEGEFVPPDLARGVAGSAATSAAAAGDGASDGGGGGGGDRVDSGEEATAERTGGDGGPPARAQIAVQRPSATTTGPTPGGGQTELTPGGRQRKHESEQKVRAKKGHGRRKQPTLMEDEEENFVLTALCRAIEDGDLEGVKQVLSEAKNFNINQTNRQGETLLHTAASSGQVDIMRFLQEKGVPLDAADKHGDTAVYWAARQGHLDVIKYLVEEGVSLNTQNKAGEAPIHVAARYGHLDLIEYLCNAGADVNVQDKLGETALHTVAWHGLPADICALLCSSGCVVDTRNKENETPLHCAASRGNLECVRVLLSHGASLNVQDKRLNTPLHLACRRRYVPIALLLLHADCAFDMTDCINETPLHPASREGLLPVVQTMCAYGCQVDIVNKGGLTPLHLAARSGHIEVVRCLLLSGSEPELPNKDGVNSEIMALAQGHQDVAELLSKLKPEKREICIKQLIPTSHPLSRIKVKVFGSSGVGKTTLIESLKCGYLSSFFRKAKLGSSSSTNSVKQKSQANGSLLRQNSLPTQLSFEVGHEGYTQGIDVQQVNISGGAGDLSIWEFSGYEPYYVTYDHFIGDPNCIHVIVFSLADPQDVQLSQVLFWLNFLKARIAPMEPIGPVGRLPWPARVLLVATHADKADCVRNTRGELENPDAYVLLATIKQKYESDLFIQDEIFLVDAHLAMSQDLKALRAKLGQMKSQIVQFLPCSNGFLEATISALAVWRKALSDYPVVTWPIFMDHVRSKVNLLSSEEHLKELMCQLQLVGEVIYVETETEQDLVVLSPKWLCSDVIGHLLSHDQLSHSRPTGCFTIDDFQLMCPETDAKDMLMILEALELCTRCEVDGEVEYEFPCLNFVEMIPGLWEKDDARMLDPVYGGLRIQCPRGMNNQLLHMFPRIQTHLRREALSDHGRPDSDLYQWYHGSKFCSGSMECLITLGQSEQVVEIKCRGPEEFRTSLYYLQEDICDIVLDVIEDSCPGICLEKYVLSALQLKQHKSSVYAYTPKDILSAQLEGTTSIALDESTREEFVDLIAFGSQEIWNNITPGIDLHAHFLSIHARRRLAILLDPPDPMGRDWCLLAVALGMTDDLPRVDQSDGQTVRSKTDTILDMWAQDRGSTIAVLIRKLRELGRQDAADALLTVSPLYHVFQEGEADTEEKTNGEPTPYSSDNTLSSSNLSR